MVEPVPAAAESREVRVFLSSTFRDFNEERQLLATQVFPRLNRQARERGVELVEVDLRWGVTQEQAEDGHALEICLKEIERCKPYFIGMLGDSYGSLTPPQRQLLQVAPELLEQRPWLDGRIGEASYTELEIEHGLQLLRDPAMVGRAFFYFRDPAYSDQKADAGEAGWRSDTPEDRQKLELLRQKIRSSGLSCKEGLPTPQSIADQIEKDLWALIDQQFPEGEQPDALEKEARKHADYRRSRTGAGQYVGGEAYIQQLEQWLAEGQQQILITGESGAGKSALIANWMEAHQQAHPADVVYAHHLGCTNDANALRPLLARLIDTASRRLQEAELIAEPLKVPEDWWDLVARVAETLQSLGHLAQKHSHRWIWVLDGLDRLDPDDQNALPWLPQNLPAGVHVVASALACPARTILSERGYTTLTIGPLAAAEQELLIQRYLQRYTKELDGGLRQQILNHPLAGSPLFLKVLLEELRQCGRHDTLKEQLAFYLSSQTVDDLYERVLERLENDGSGDSVRKVMTTLWASRAGLSETELLAITGLAPLQWAPIDLALEKAFGRNGNRLVFDHDFLRTAVKDQYLATEEARRQAHSDLADWYEAKEVWDARKAEELPWQLQQASRRATLRAMLLNVGQLFELAEKRDDRELINYWHAVKGDDEGELDELIAAALIEEIKKRREDAKDLASFAARIADLFDEAGLYREQLLRLRTLLLELEDASDDKSEELTLSNVQRLADVHFHLGNHEAALALYQRCLEAREQLQGLNHPKIIPTFNNLGLTCLGKYDFDKARDHFNRALEVAKESFGLEDRRATPILNNLALLNEEEGRYSEAIELLEKCIEINSRQIGPGARDTLTSKINLARLWREQDLQEQAISLCNECLSLEERLLGKEHPDVCATLNLLGLLYADIGDFEEAIQLLKRALESSLRLLGEEHPSTLSTTRNLAHIYGEQGDLVNAENLARAELAARDRLNEPFSLEVLVSKENLADILRRKGDLAEAERLYRNIHECKEEALAAHSPLAHSTALPLAGVLSELGRFNEAIILRREDLLRSHEIGEEDFAILDKKQWLAEDLYHASKLQEAENLLREILSEREHLLGSGHDDVMRTIFYLTEILSKQGRYSEAIPLRRRQLVWFRQKNGDTDRGTLTSINNLAIDLRDAGELEEAEALFRELIEAGQQVLEPEDFRIGRALGGLAKTLEDAGKLEEALAFRLQALDHRLAHEGPHDWWTNRGRFDLARILHKLGRNPEARTLLQELQASMARIEAPDDDDRQLMSDAADLQRTIDASS